jgi:sporulation protein YlmC with PRC-barrel domain
MLAAFAALAAAPAMAQQTDTPSRWNATVPSTADFRSSEWLRDRAVVNSMNEKIANVSDLILDRGSGRIEYLVIKTDTMLGLGGRAVAIPYDAFHLDTVKDRFVLASTAEQLKQFPEYSPEAWKDMMEARKGDMSTLRQRLAADAAAPSDPYAASLDTAKSARIEGVITDVDRVRTSTFGEQVFITVRTADGATRKIAMGPSWFVNGSFAAPMRGDKVVVDTLALPRDPDQLLAATRVQTGSRELRLRDTGGSPAWTLETIESNGHVYSAPFSRYLLLSQLPGKKINARGNECGKVNDIILDRASGEIGFISIDPNENFLGIGDTKHLVPWSIASMALDDVVRIDASKEMILASPAAPSDLSKLTNSDMAQAVYNAYGVPAPRFDARTPLTTAIPAKDSAWSVGGAILRAIDRDSAKTISGKMTGFTNVTFENGVQPARAIKIRMAGDGAKDETILLGPSMYMDHQELNCKAGDSIKVDAIRTIINGRNYWLARSVEFKGKSIVLLDGKNAPAWDKP